MPDFDTKHAGQKLHIGASEWNKLGEMARRDLLAKAEGGPVPYEQGIVPVYVWNNTTTDVQRYGIIAINGTPGVAQQVALISRTTNTEEFMSRPSLIGTTPLAVTPSQLGHVGRFVIALEPIPKGNVGRCAVGADLIPVQVNFTGTNGIYFDYADVKDSDFTQLEACAHGRAYIVHRDSGSSGTIWCLVRLGTHQRPVRLGRNGSGTAGVPVKGWLAAGYAGPIDGSPAAAYVRDTVNGDFDIRETLPAALNLGRFSWAANGPGLFLGDRGEWWGLPIYDSGIRAGLSGSCAMSGGTLTDGTWAAHSPALDTAELITTINSTDITIRYAAPYTMIWNLSVTNNFSAPTAAGDPPTQTEFNTLVTRLTNYCTFTLPAATSGTVTYYGSLSPFALEIPMSSSGRKDHCFVVQCDLTEGAVLGPPKFQSSNGVSVSYKMLLQAACDGIKVND